MGYKLKTHSGAAKRFKKLEHLLKVEALIEIIFLQNNQLKEKDIIEVLTSYLVLFLKWLPH